MMLGARNALYLSLGLGLAVAPLACKHERTEQSAQPLASSTTGACPHALRCKDPKTAVACVNGSEREQPCRGPSGCQTEGSVATCDNLLARTGDACDEEHDFACATDRKAALECQSGTFKPVTEYDGIEGCELKGDELECEGGKPLGCDEIEDIACCLTFARRRKHP